MAFYVEVEKDLGNIVRLGETSSKNIPEPQEIGNITMEVNSKEYFLLSACHGDVWDGVKTLTRFSDKVKDKIGFWNNNYPIE